MNDPIKPLPDDARLHHLADRALFDPGSPLPTIDDLALATDLELAAASAYLAMDDRSHEPMPESLRGRVMSDAAGFFAGVPPPATVARLPRERTRAPWVSSLGWVAAAASLALAFWSVRTSPQNAPPTIAEQREILRQTVRPIRLSASDHPLARGASGELIWSESRQQGYMTLRGLAEVNPNKGAYQLWIFDGKRDARYPIDGGLFTVANASQPTIIPVRPRIPVGDPTLFAITLEPPGGVVVSDRKRIMMTGP